MLEIIKIILQKNHIGSSFKKNKKGKILFIKGGNDPRNYRVNFSKLENKLGFKTKYSLNYGIDEIINFFKSKKIKSKNFKLENMVILKFNVSV